MFTICQCQTSKSFLSLFILPNLVPINSEATHKYIRIKTNKIRHHNDSFQPHYHRPDPHQTITFGFPPSVRLNTESTLSTFYQQKEKDSQTTLSNFSNQTRILNPSFVYSKFLSPLSTLSLGDGHFQGRKMIFETPIMGLPINCNWLSIQR